MQNWSLWPLLPQVQCLRERESRIVCERERCTQLKGTHKQEGARDRESERERMCVREAHIQTQRHTARGRYTEYTLGICIRSAYVYARHMYTLGIIPTTPESKRERERESESESERECVCM